MAQTSIKYVFIYLSIVTGNWKNTCGTYILAWWLEKVGTDLSKCAWNSVLWDSSRHFKIILLKIILTLIKNKKHLLTQMLLTTTVFYFLQNGQNFAIIIWKYMQKLQWREISSRNYIYSNSWQDYKTDKLKTSGFRYYTVNHRYSFFDPNIDANMQKCIKRMFLCSHLAEKKTTGKLKKYFGAPWQPE